MDEGRDSARSARGRPSALGDPRPPSVVPADRSAAARDVRRRSADQRCRRGMDRRSTDAIELDLSVLERALQAARADRRPSRDRRDRRAARPADGSEQAVSEGEGEEAVAVLGQVLQRHREDPHAPRRPARRHRRQGDDREAREAGEEARDVDGQDHRREETVEGRDRPATPRALAHAIAKRVPETIAALLDAWRSSTTTPSVHPSSPI